MAEKPRWDKDSPILHAQLNALADAAWQIFALRVDESTGLSLAMTPDGITIGLTPQRVATYAVVLDGGITAAAGLTLGRGEIELYYKDDHGVLQPYGNPSEDCFNSTPATAAAGDIIQAKYIDGDWAWDVASCS